MGSSVPSGPSVYAEQLLGLTLTGAQGAQWRVVRQIPRRRPGATGGNFSVGYIVVDEAGREAFLKALDFSHAFRASNFTQVLQVLTTTYNFERDLLSHCRERRLDRVVSAVDHGEVVVDPNTFASNVPFIVFELADGDVRSFAQFAQRFDAAWALRSLHHVATGLGQLHSRQIAHQDVKPSNVMYFGDVGSKIGDLGRAAQRGHAPPHDGFAIAGDPSYAPPELLYGATPTDWSERRYGCDVYLLGSLVVSLFTGASMTGLLVHYLAPEQHWTIWRDTYAAVLPFVRDAFDQAVDAFGAQVPQEFRAEAVRIVRQLCDPDPSRRGHPRARAQRHGNPLALDRYVAEFNLLATRAERGVKLSSNGSAVLGARGAEKPSSAGAPGAP